MSWLVPVNVDYRQQTQLYYLNKALLKVTLHIVLYSNVVPSLAVCERRTATVTVGFLIYDQPFQVMVIAQRNEKASTRSSECFQPIAN